MKEVDRLKQQLRSVREAIHEIESGSQSFEIESNGAKRKASRADLSLLCRREGELSVRIKRLTRGVQTLRFGD
jgi:hypothetical protein